MSVIFHSFGLSPFSSCSSTGVFHGPGALLLPPAPHFQVPLGFRVNIEAEENALTKDAKNQPLEVLLLSAQHDTTT